MLIGNNKKRYLKSSFLNEEELENVVINNYERIFGPNSIYLPKTLIKTPDGFGTIPDGFAIDLESQRWYLIEAELSTHDTWNHIFTQVTKQVIASQKPESKKRLIKGSIDQFKNDMATREKFSEMAIEDINIHEVLNGILDKNPIVGIPIDEISNDLRSLASQFNFEVKLWQISKFVELTNKEDIMYEFPEDFKPEFDTEIKKIGKDRFDLSISDLIGKKMLKVGEKLVMKYKSRQGNEVKYEAYLNENGTFNLFGQNYSSPSDAALAGIKKAGSDRDTVNGWTSWKNAQGETLADLRERYLPSKPESIEPEETKPKGPTNKEEKIEIFANYKRQLYKATYYSPDKIVSNGKDYTSPSAAGTAVTNKPCNGWNFWKFKDETGNEHLLDKLREKTVPSVIEKKERNILDSREKSTSDRDITQDSEARRIFANYKRQLYKASYYSPDKIVYNGKDYTSPSAAGTAVTNKPCNGWNFWKFKDETGNEHLLDKLRQRSVTH